MRPHQRSQQGGQPTATRPTQARRERPEPRTVRVDEPPSTAATGPVASTSRAADGGGGRAAGSRLSATAAEAAPSDAQHRRRLPETGTRRAAVGRAADGRSAHRGDAVQPPARQDSTAHRPVRPRSASAVSDASPSDPGTTPRSGEAVAPGSTGRPPCGAPRAARKPGAAAPSSGAVAHPRRGSRAAPKPTLRAAGSPISTYASRSAGTRTLRPCSSVEAQQLRLAGQRLGHGAARPPRQSARSPERSRGARAARRS